MPNRSIEIPCIYATLEDADVLAGVATTANVGREDIPARRCIVGSIGAAGVTLTRPGGTEVVVSQAQLQALGGVVDRQFVAIQSDNSTDIGIDW
jgi:hypothetical protein